MVRGHGEILLPEDAFGSCFRRTIEKSRVYELGFDRASLRRNPALIAGLVPGSAAARAGLQEGMLVLASKLPKGEDPKKNVELTIAGPRGGKKLRYKPLAERETRRWTEKRCSR